MAKIGDRVEVSSPKAGQPSRAGVVTAISGALITVHWDTGEETRFIPGPGVMSVVGTGRVAKTSPARKRPSSGGRPAKKAPAAKRAAATKKAAKKKASSTAKAAQKSKKSASKKGKKK
jgi:uncharacterized protein DUF1918